MNTSELLQNSLSVPVKELASDLNLSKEQVYKWMDGSQRNPIDRVEAIISACDNDKIIRHLCQQSGGFFVSMPEVKTSNSEVCAKACKEFGELLTAMSEALQDNEVDKAEYDRIYSEWNDLENVMHSFFREKVKNL